MKTEVLISNKDLRKKKSKTCLLKMHMQGSGRTGQALHYLDKRVSHQIQKLISTQLTQLSMMKQRYSVFLNDKHNTSEGFLHQKCVLGK